MKLIKLCIQPNICSSLFLTFAVYLDMLRACLLLLIGGCGLFLLIESCRSSQHEDSRKISYNFDIRPILSDKCFSCHGPDANKRQAGLRLDIAKIAYDALKEHPGAHALV